MSLVPITEKTLMRDARYWHPERTNFAAWVTGGWQALTAAQQAPGGERTVTVFVSACTRVVDGKVRHVSAYTQQRHLRDGDHQRLAEPSLHLAAGERKPPDGRTDIPPLRIGRPLRTENVEIPPLRMPILGGGLGRGWTGPRPNGPRIHEGRQGKHIEGRNDFIEGRSTLVPGIDPQDLLNRFAGTGEAHAGFPVPEPNSRETFDTGGQIIGHYRTRDGVAQPTTRGTIHYGARGAHIVPAPPRR